MNTNMHVTRPQAETLLDAVRFEIACDDPSSDVAALRAAEKMLLAALARIRDAEDKRDKKGVWA